MLTIETVDRDCYIRVVIFSFCHKTFSFTPMKVIWILELFTLVCSREILELVLVRVRVIYYFLTPSFLNLGSMSPHLKHHDIILVFEIPPIKMPSSNPCSLPPLESMLVYYIKLQHSQTTQKEKASTFFSKFINI